MSRNRAERCFRFYFFCTATCCSLSATTSCCSIWRFLSCITEKKKRKALIFCVLKPARWHKETIRKPVLRDYQTNYRARSRCREQQLFDFKDPDNSVCLIIRLYIWLTDKPWLSPQRICDLVSSESRAGILLHQTQVTFLFSSYL